MCLYSLDMGFKSSSSLTETLLDPEFGHACEPNKTAFNKAYNVEEDIWSWSDLPENRLHIVRFGVAMNGLKNASPANAILEGSLTLCCIYLAPSPHFRSRVRLGTPPWGVTCCRCRGGVGAQSLTLAKHHSLRYPGLGVCFGRCDRRMCNESNQTLRNKACAYYGMYWPSLATVFGEEHAGCTRIWPRENSGPEPAQHDDYNPENVSVFLLSKIFHNWADENCLIILKHLRAATGPKTQLLIVDQVMSFACDEPVSRKIPGAVLPVPPRRRVVGERVLEGDRSSMRCF